MALTEDMLSGMAKEITGSYKVRYHPDVDDEEKVVEIDFTPPFKRISMLDGLEEAMGAKIPLPLESEECRTFLEEQCKAHEVCTASVPFALRASHLNRDVHCTRTRARTC
jgi:lysyl-tRNA synthetase class 2